MSDHDPRWRDDPELDEGLRALLDAGAAELPHDEQLERLEARLFPLIPPGGGGGGPAGSVGALTKAALALGGIAAITGAVWVITQSTARRGDDGISPSVMSAADAAIARDTDAGARLDAPIDAGRDPLAVDAGHATLDPGPRPRGRPAADPAAELTLVESAQSALSSSPARALALTRTHSRDYPDGALAQEREVIAIDALMRLDRASAARTRAARFHERWPTSAHGRRVDVLVATD